MNNVQNYIQPLGEKPITHLMQWNKERVKVDCPVCHQYDWEKLDHIRRPIVDSHLCICKKCGFISYDPQLKDIMDWYRYEVRPQSANFIATKQNKLIKHKNLLFKYLKKNKIKPKKVLDYGCSDGYVLKELRKHYPKSIYKGIEINKGHANWGKYIDDLDITTDSDLDNIEEKYDLIILYHVLEHVQQPDIFIDKLRDKLTDDGLIYMACPTLDRLDYPTIEVLFKDEHINWWFAENLEEFLLLHGLKREFIDKHIYGTCMILSKNPPLKTFQNRYEKHMKQLLKIKEHYEHRKMFDKNAVDKNKAKPHAEAAVKAFEESPETIIRYAQCMDTVDMEDYLEIMMKKKPYMTELKGMALNHYFKYGDYEKAKEIANDLIEQQGYSTMVYDKLYQIERIEGNLGKAVEYLREIVKNNPYNPNYFNILCAIVAEM